MITIETALTFSAASLLIGLAPGPDNLFVLTQSALHGCRAGLMVTCGLCTGLLVHTVAVAAGVAAVLKASIIAFSVLKIAGAGYLLYLAWKSFTSVQKELAAEKDRREIGMAGLYRRGIIMNITNPKVSIFFLAFLPQFIDPAGGSTVLQTFSLGALFIVTTVIVFGGVALLAGSLGQMLKSSPKIRIVMNRIAGLVFLGLAVKIATASNK
jgi:threonine/homoserine/homoserine lactone efflux protein